MQASYSSKWRMVATCASHTSFTRFSCTCSSSVRRLPPTDAARCSSSAPLMQASRVPSTPALSTPALHASSSELSAAATSRAVLHQCGGDGSERARCSSSCRFAEKLSARASLRMSVSAVISYISNS